MTYSQFIDKLRADKRYETPDHLIRQLPRRHPAWATLKFHSLNLYNVISHYAVVRCGKWNYDHWAIASYKALRYCEKAGAKLRIEGYEHILGLDKPVVYVANHMSLLETFAMACLTRPAGKMCFVIKESLLKYPFFGPILQCSEAVTVTRLDPRQDLKAVMEQGKERLQSGSSMIIFPQATRSTEFISSKFNSLGVRLAVKAGVPVVPVAVRTDFLRPGSMVRDFGPVDPTCPVCFGFSKPLQSDNIKELQAATIDAICAYLRDWEVPCS